MFKVLFKIAIHRFKIMVLLANFMIMNLESENFELKSDVKIGLFDKIVDQ